MALPPAKKTKIKRAVGCNFKMKFKRCILCDVEKSAAACLLRP